ECLMIRDVRGETKGPWRPFSGTIEGFKFEEGYLYRIVVSFERQPDPRAGTTSLRYRMLRLLEKMPVVR
ncbi:MAG: hypothetical protein C4333_14195, partial [Meiothermus sp.]